jgi:hypothetical protein
VWLDVDQRIRNAGFVREFFGAAAEHKKRLLSAVIQGVDDACDIWLLGLRSANVTF